LSGSLSQVLLCFYSEVDVGDIYNRFASPSWFAGMPRITQNLRMEDQPVPTPDPFTDIPETETEIELEDAATMEDKAQWLGLVVVGALALWALNR
jgi:hypothetical protein